VGAQALALGQRPPPRIDGAAIAPGAGPPELPGTGYHDRTLLLAEMRFDTEKMVERLEDAGVPHGQALIKAEFEKQRLRFDDKFEDLRHYVDAELEKQRMHFDAELEKLRQHVDSELEKLRQHVDTELEKLRLHVDAELEKQRMHFAAEIGKLRLEFHAQLSNTRGDLIKWVVSVGILQMALIAALVLKLVP
jgi:ribosome-associated translation inhibitor RaiA